MPGAPPGLTSIVILCCGQLEYTRLCLPSVLRFSQTPYEIIVIDAGSLDGTSDYWAGVQAAAPVSVEIVHSPADRDLPLALQEGLALASGEFVLLLNNDTVVTDSWLNQLTALAAMSPVLGMIAPMTNYGPGPQVVSPVPYRLGRVASMASVGSKDIREQIDRVNRFAREFREQQRGQWAEAERLGGGCVLLRRATLEAIGALTGSPLGFYDAEALSQRVLQAGFRLACCRDLFVHSFGSRGFVAGAPPPTSHNTPGSVGRDRGHS